MLKRMRCKILPYRNKSFVTYLRKNIIFPFYWKCIRSSNVLKYYHELKAHQWNSLEENKKIQRKKLFNLIHYASQNIPYYQRMINESHIRFSEESIFEDIKKFPLLTKEIIRSHFNELYKFKDRTYYKNTSGGSTGEPVVFYQDREYFSWAAANKILISEWAGKKIGEPNAVMTTAGVLYPEVRQKFIDVFRTRVFNRYGSQEVSDIACNCEKDEGLHMYTFIHYLEIVNDEGKEVEGGRPGNIILTLLNNYTMPLIRYKIGDRRILSPEYSQCSHGFPSVKRVSGRIKFS